eukprot:gene26435-35089_t
MSDYNLKDGEVSTGTTIMAVTFDGGVILGADSRTSTGSYVANRVSDKVVPIHDYIWACRSGSAADTQAVTDAVKHYINAHRSSPSEDRALHTSTAWWTNSIGKE